MSRKRYEELLAASPYSYACPLKKITEDDFDRIMGSVGGVRIAEANDKTRECHVLITRLWSEMALGRGFADRQ